MLFEDYMEERI